MVSHLRLLLPRMEAAGIRVALAAPEALNSALSGCLGPDVPVSAAPIRSRPHPVADVRAASCIARIASGTDLLHGHGLRGAWIAALAARFARKPFLFTAHNLAHQSGNPLTRLVLRYAVRRAAAIVCVSKAVGESLVHYGAAPDRIVIISNGIDLDSFDRVVERDAVLRRLGVGGSPVITAVGRLAPEKGFATLINAATMVVGKIPEARFVIAGDGPEREALQERVAAVGLAEAVRLVGRIDDVAELLLASDLVVVPSHSEGQGIVALEAMAARKPVVASRVGGLVETVEDGITGILVPPADSGALAAGLLHLLSEPEAWESMGAAGRTRAESEYTADLMAERTAGVYHRLAGRDI